jgi:hypothetical protein
VVGAGAGGGVGVGVGVGSLPDLEQPASRSRPAKERGSNLFILQIYTFLNVLIYCTS